MLLQRFRDWAEDHADLGKLCLEGRSDRHRIEHRIDGDASPLHAGENLAFAQRNAKLLVGAQQGRIDLVQRLRPRHRFRCRVVIEVLEVDLGIVHAGPGGLLHGQPPTIGLEPPLGHPLRLGLLGRDEAHDILVQALGGLVGLDVGDESVLVGIDVDGFHPIDGLLDGRHCFSPHPTGFKDRRFRTSDTSGAAAPITLQRERPAAISCSLPFFGTSRKSVPHLRQHCPSQG